MNVRHRAHRPLTVLLAVLLTLLLVAPAAAQQHGGGGSGGDGGGGSGGDGGGGSGGDGGGGGKGGEYAELVVAYRDVNGVPIVLGPFVGEHGEEYCVQPVTTQQLPNPRYLLGDTEADEYLPMAENPVDGRLVTIIPLFASYPDLMPEPAEVGVLHDPGEEDEGGEPCDPLVIDEHNYGQYVSEVELERLNLARSPDGVLERHLAELVALFEASDPELVGLDAAGRPVFPDEGIDAMPKLQAMRQELLEHGTMRGNLPAAYPYPFRLVSAGFERWDTWQLSAFALGGAASKFGSINVDAVVYHDRILAIAEDWLANDADGSLTAAGWAPAVHSYALDTLGERFVDYSGIAYSREDTFPGCVTYLDPATWQEGYKVASYSEVVDFTTPTPTQTNLAGYAQMAEDARAMILFIHDYEPVIAYGDPVGMESCEEQGLALPALNDPDGSGETTTPPSGGSSPAPSGQAGTAVLDAEPVTTAVFDCSDWRDLGQGNTHRHHICALAADGILGGYTDTTFGPDTSVTRGQVASALARAAGLEGLTPATPTFSDIAGTAHQASIEALAEAGIVEGFADGTFRPGLPVQRAQVASLLARWLGIEPIASGPFTDVVPGSVHAGAINALTAREVIRGMTQSTFGPELAIRRDQFAAMLDRAR